MKSLDTIVSSICKGFKTVLLASSLSFFPLIVVGAETKHDIKPQINSTSLPLLYVNDGFVCLNSVKGDSEVKLFFDGENPKFSPDGKNIAYEKDTLKYKKYMKDKGDCIESDDGIWLFSLDNRKNIRLTDIGRNPVWSPNGKKILYEKDNIGNPGEKPIEGKSVWLYDLEKKTDKEISKGRNACWSPNGKKILYGVTVESELDRDIKNLKMYVLNLDDNNQEDFLISSTRPIPVWIDNNSFVYNDHTTLNLYNIVTLSDKPIFNDVLFFDLSDDMKTIALNYIHIPSRSTRLCFGKIHSEKKEFYIPDTDGEFPGEFLKISADDKKVGFIINEKEDTSAAKVISNTFFPNKPYCVAVYNFEDDKLKKLQTNIKAEILGMDWLKNLNNPNLLWVNYWNNIKLFTKTNHPEGIEFYWVMFTPRSLRPDIFKHVGLENSLLNTDQIIIYDVNAGFKIRFSGHSLDVYKSKN